MSPPYHNLHEALHEGYGSRTVVSYKAILVDRTLKTTLVRSAGISTLSVHRDGVDQRG